jgi:TRAP transporter TAXI family solute receptor
MSLREKSAGKSYNKLNFLNVIILSTFFCFAYPLNKTHILRLATGSPKGVYYQLGKWIASVAKKEGLEIKILGTRGAAENIYLVSEGKADLGIVQSDVAYNAYNALGSFKEQIKNIQAICSLYTEAIHIVVRNPLSISRIEDFKGKRICVGPKDSGTESNAIALLESSGIGTSEVHLINLPFEEYINALKESKVDICFFTVGYPCEAITEILNSKIGYLYEPNLRILENLLKIFPSYVITTIPPMTYPHQREDITTMGVPALLICRDGLGNQLIYKLTRAIFANYSSTAGYHPKTRTIKLSSALKGISIPLNGGAKQFYVEKGLYKNNAYIRWLYLLILLFSFAFLFYLFHRKGISPLRLIISLPKREVTRVLILLVFTWFVGSIVLYISEKKINENYSSVYQALWSGLINWINFGSKEPLTRCGRIVSIIMSSIGIVGFTWLTGEVASVLIHRKMMGGIRLYNLKNHYVIINWNEEAPEIVRQLSSPEIERRPIVVITEQQNVDLPTEKVHHIKGDPTDISRSSPLRKANVGEAHAVIILARENIDEVEEAEKKEGADSKESLIEKKAEETDAFSVLIILAIRKICEEANKRLPPIVVEILDPQKASIAEYAGGIGNGYIEVVCAHRLAAGLLAQVAVNRGLAKIYEDLLTFEEKTQEIHSVSLPPSFEGESFTALLREFTDLRDKGINILPIGIRRGAEIFLNPSIQLKANDVLFAICDSAKELEKALEIISKKEKR